MPHLSRRARPVLPGALFAILVMVLATACGDAPGAGDQGVPPRPPTQPPATPPDVQPAPSPSPGVVSPVPGRRERRVPWRLVRAVPGPAVLVEVQAGGPPCDAITGLDVSESSRAVVLTVWAGRLPGARCVGVPALLGTFHVRVPLAEPLGARTLEPS